MKSTVVLFLGALMSVGAMAAPYGQESKSIEPVPTTTECETATWTPYDYNKSTVPYEPSHSAPYGHKSKVEPTTVAYYGPTSEPVETTLPTGYPYPHGPEEEPTTTVTSILESTLTVSLSTYEPYGPESSPSKAGYWTTLTTTSCPPTPSSDGVPGYVPYTPTLTPVPYEYTTPASLYEPETPTPVVYPTTPVYYPPSNEPTPTEYNPGNNTYPTSTPPYVPPPYAGSATSLVNNGGFVGMVAGLVGMVAVMIIL
ncbi:hypothetical protein TWF102_007817 [Orbilia oligospora]|uniref:Uncharacterized protein n=1 Tax=Orbilia oligospora TaxID=2813651 RepID=A0A7C8JZF8_ORBOL|nr:hypothetical protein TWF102_007817 [Orbilia oligospora]KAF3100874.1 hypothetical protein TWF706_005971 [Orbilia oligospora]KAF3116670.1 hypothetical protein TWF103_008430 [Orbilia oligospora]KAF3134938.1 hypothetical protein TWF594_008550 [Orbilia oligospora]KAF3135162.1 hypothetical protein TWF703_006075 [Orbilia oligospora]